MNECSPTLGDPAAVAWTESRHFVLDFEVGRGAQYSFQHAFNPGAPKDECRNVRQSLSSVRYEE
jgi:hypothetical protein